jgi:hypothetical protein
MYNHPTAAELIAAARMHIEQHMLPSIAEPRLRFQTLVATNVLAIVERELAFGEHYLAATWQRLAELEGSDENIPSGSMLRSDVNMRTKRLCERIRAGEYDDEPYRSKLLAHLRRTAEEQLLVANPRYLERVKREDG